MRQANPDLDVDSIKRILMETARDEGLPGEDNDYGWGFIDAHAAVLRAVTGYGRVEGTCSNNSLSGAPLPGVSVSLLGTGYRFLCDERGAYRGSALPGTYLAVAQIEGFAPDSAEIRLQGGEQTRRDFSLTDIAGPLLQVAQPEAGTLDPLGPYPLRILAQDPSGIAALGGFYRRDEWPWLPLPVTAEGSDWLAEIPGALPDTRIKYYLESVDGAGLKSTWPEGAPDAAASLQVRRLALAESFEDGPARGWEVGGPEDTAPSGLWVQADPEGTEEEGIPMQPGDDHTPGAGAVCFVTGNAPPGARAGDNDVDDGCTTLYSPVYEFPAEKEVFLSYWRWFALGGASTDDTLRVDISGDGGESWQPLERVAQSDSLWRQAAFDLTSLLPSTEHVRLRFRACDLHDRGVVEAAIDDVILATFDPRGRPPGSDAGAPLTLDPPAPNPSRCGALLRFWLPAPGEVEILVLDVGGRLVRRYPPQILPSGWRTIPWDGRDAQGRALAAGVYYWRVRAGGEEAARAVTLVR